MQRDLVTQLTALTQARLDHSDRVIERGRQGDFGAARALIAGGEGKRRMDSARLIITEMLHEESHLLEVRSVLARQGERNARLALWTAGALAVFLVALVAYAAVYDGRRLRRAHEELSTTLRSIGDAVISTDAMGVIRFMNAIAEDLTGWKASDARGKSLEQVFHIVNEQTRAPVESPVAKVLREGTVVGLANHTVLISRAGSELAIEDSGAPIFEGEQILGVVLVFRDATTQRAAEKALRESEQRFRAAIDAVQGVLWTNTADGEMRGEQPSWAALTGQTVAEYQGFGWAKAVHPDDAQPTIDAWLIAVRERRTFVFEHRVRRHDGVWRAFSIRAIPVLDAAGAIREWVGVHTDISEQRESERALRASEGRYRAIQDTSIDGFMVLESVRNVDDQIVDFRWIHANEAAERIVGKPRSWFTGRRLLEEMPANRQEGLFDAYVKVVETGKPWTHEFSYQHEGVSVYMRLIAAKSEDGFAASFADLSERYHAEQQVQERERQFVSLANAMPQLVWTESPSGAHIFFNRGWYAYTGLTAEESKAIDAWDRVTHPEDIERRGARWARSLARGEPYEAEFRLRRHDGAYRWFLARAVADRDEKGKILQWFGTCTDIDATKRTEENLRKTEVALREADLRKDVFLATLSHELRNPLAPIRNAASLLENSSLRPEAVERSRLIIGRQVRHMAALLDDLLDVSRITRGVFVLKKEYVNLQGILAEAVETARPLIDTKRHALTLDWPSDSIEIEADPVRLVQIISNLLTNAAKYTDPEGKIHFSARIEHEQLLISVRDTGIGLTPEMLPKVFEMFSQVSPDQERSEGGLGIGLALVRGLVELHGGRIEARSSGLERGSEFIAYLPCLHLDTGIYRQMPLDTSASAVTGGSVVLIADDNRDGAESMAMLLELSGHQIYLAHTGPEAVAKATQHRPDVAILDIGMPGLSGYEVAKRIRAEAWGSRLILIAMTGWGQEDDKRKAKEAGFDHHVTKPVDPSILEQLIVRGD